MASVRAAGLPPSEQAAASMAPQVAHEQVPERPGASQNIAAGVHERPVVDHAPYQSMEDMMSQQVLLQLRDKETGYSDDPLPPPNMTLTPLDAATAKLICFCCKQSM